MQPDGVHAFKLQCHPDTPCPEVRSINVRLERQADGLHRLRYLLDGHISRLRIPAPLAPSRTDGLWRATCFEAFVAPSDAPIYYELNFSPSSQWALYRFDAYREGMSPADIEKPPAISVRHSDYRLELDAAFNMETLPELTGRSSLKVALAAVIESEDGRMSYWALRHPAVKPDFHHADGFVSVSR
jgi:hypothetical protein